MKFNIRYSWLALLIFFLPPTIAWGITHLASRFPEETAFILSIPLFCLVPYRFAPWNRYSTNMNHSEKSLFDRAYSYYPRGYRIMFNTITITASQYLKGDKFDPAFNNALSDSALEYSLSNPNSTHIFITSEKKIPFSLSPYLCYQFKSINASGVKVMNDKLYCTAAEDSCVEEIVFPFDAPLDFFFESCPNLNRLEVKNPKPPSLAMILDEPRIIKCHPDIALYVPYESLSEYQNDRRYQKITVKYSDGTIKPIPIKPISTPEPEKPIYIPDYVIH